MEKDKGKIVRYNLKAIFFLDLLFSHGDEHQHTSPLHTFFPKLTPYRWFCEGVKLKECTF